MNIHGARFVDEGADFRNFTYVKYGREILYQPQRVAFQIFDEKVKDLLRDEYRIPQATMITSDTLEGLAGGLGIDPQGLADTITRFNAGRPGQGVQPGHPGRQGHGRYRSSEVQLGLSPSTRPRTWGTR